MIDFGRQHLTIWRLQTSDSDVKRRSPRWKESLLGQRRGQASNQHWVNVSCILGGLVLSCLVLSCLVLSCLVLSCLVLSCLVLSCLVLSCLVSSCLVRRLIQSFCGSTLRDTGFESRPGWIFIIEVVVQTVQCPMVCYQTFKLLDKHIGHSPTSGFLPSRYFYEFELNCLFLFINNMQLEKMKLMDF